MDLFARFVGIWMMFVIYIAVGVEGAAWDTACTGSGAGDCTEANNKCDGTSNKCACDDDSFRRTSPAECVIKIVAGSTCVAGDTCADTNAACHSTDLQCLCASTHFQKNDNTCATKVAALDAGCESAQTATDQCAVTDSECRDDSGTDKCLCKATHYTNGAACTARKNPDIACTAVGQCITNAECDTADSNQCKCNAGYTATPTTTPTMCSGVVKFASLSYMYVVPIIVSMMFLIR